MFFKSKTEKVTGGRKSIILPNCCCLFSITVLSTPPWSKAKTNLHGPGYGFKKQIRNVQGFKELEYLQTIDLKKIMIHLTIFNILELVTTWINQPRLEKEEFVMVVPGRKGLHLLVTFVNIKDIIKALFICNAGHNNNKQPLVINYSYWCKKSLLITKLPPLMIHSFTCSFM